MLLCVLSVAAIVLLIACATVAILMLVRVLRRSREITVRLALGIGRRRLVAQFLTEAMVLSLIGCVAGLVVAQWVAQPSWSLVARGLFFQSRAMGADSGACAAAKCNA